MVPRCRLMASSGRCGSILDPACSHDADRPNIVRIKGVNQKIIIGCLFCNREGVFQSGRLRIMQEDPGPLFGGEFQIELAGEQISVAEIGLAHPDSGRGEDDWKELDAFLPCRALSDRLRNSTNPFEQRITCVAASSMAPGSLSHGFPLLS